jgi:arylsulfatase A-like enzyme
MLACGPERSRPDVVVITVDTMRADHLGAYGHAAARTPNLDALAKRGRRFTNATTPSPRTTPALASLFTGLWPQHHGARAVALPLTRGRTLAETLQPLGWVTLGVSASKVAGRKENLHRGFDVFVERHELPHWRAEVGTHVALERAREVPAEAPLFLWIHYQEPHAPYNPPKRFQPGASAEPCRSLFSDLNAGTLSRPAMERNAEGRAERVREACLELYDAEIAYSDQQIGRLLEGLRDLGRLRPGYVVVTSDHGENFGEGGIYYQHGANVHDSALRVPLLVAGPTIAPGVDDEVFRLEDLAPTLLGLLAIPAEGRPTTDGVDLSARLRGETQEGSAALVAFGESAGGGERTARTARLKLVERRSEDGARERVLYDLEEDPGETRDASARHPEAASRLARELQAWADAAPPMRPIDYDEDQLRRLRALGYVE